ncbi:MAG: iron-containing alcohol dehydrogenase [Aquincola sp.]|nr:iron-containing alcohol dehydrogenase [Aquincola sp.]
MPDKFDELAHAVGLPNGGEAFVPWLKTLKAQIGIEGGLAARGVTHEHLARLVPLAAADFTSRTNPRPATEADYERLIRAKTAALSADDHDKLAAAILTLAVLTRELEAKDVSIHRLRRLVFGPSTEKTSHVVGSMQGGKFRPRGQSGDGEGRAGGHRFPRGRWQS